MGQEDRGWRKYWGEVRLAEELIEPVCQGSMLRYSWGKPGDAGARSRILFSNPASRSREKLTLKLSYDEGNTWPVSRELYAGSAAYSCVVKMPDGKVGVLFERDGYSRITFVQVGIDWLEGAEVGRERVSR